MCSVLLTPQPPPPAASMRHIQPASASEQHGKTSVTRTYKHESPPPPTLSVNKNIQNIVWALHVRLCVSAQSPLPLQANIIVAEPPPPNISSCEVLENESREMRV